MSSPSVLDNPVWSSLSGIHRPVADIVGGGGRYRPGISLFAAVADQDDDRAWVDLAEVVGPGGLVAMAGTTRVGAGWEIVGQGMGVQLVATDLETAPDPEAVRLTPDDVPDMLDLVARTEPGPFQPGTIELGTYLGIRQEGRLVAMAGERLHPAGWTEISAVCTDPAVERRGLATRLVRAVAGGIRDRGETPFLHAAATNTGAIRLYEALGFELRREMPFGRYKAGAGAG